MSENKSSEDSSNSCCVIPSFGGMFWLFNLIYAFAYGSFWWGILNIFLPIAFLIDLVKYIANLIK